MLDRKPVKRLAPQILGGREGEKDGRRPSRVRRCHRRVTARRCRLPRDQHGGDRDRRKVELERLVIEFKASLRDREKDAHNQILRRYAHRDGLVDTDRKAKSQDSQVAKMHSCPTMDSLFGDLLAEAAKQARRDQRRERGGHECPRD